ncbi:unnamed protein product, partial [Linum tenue]
MSMSTLSPAPFNFPRPFFSPTTTTTASPLTTITSSSSYLNYRASFLVADLYWMRSKQHCCCR